MAEIRQLPQEVADQISAGEVIERPASVVKELIENSIDAGSKNVLVSVTKGGKKKIRVRDDGCGITREDLELAFARYATSKISDIDDIYSLQSLGFRGEALASIASVARVEVKTKCPDKSRGNYIELRGSRVVDKKPAGCPQGTDIRVTDLFFNTPARYKYMKTDSTEFGHISSTVTRQALARPDIQFTLRHNDREVLKTPGTGKLKDTIFAIYGKELTGNLLPAVEFEDRYVRVDGYIAEPGFTRSSRIHQHFFVNRRPVHNIILNRAVEEAYSGFLKSSSRHPVAFLFLELNPVLIDVNVHPTKREVKFSRSRIIKEIIKEGIKNKLRDSEPAGKLDLHKDDFQKSTGKNEEQKTAKLFIEESEREKESSTDSNNNINKDSNSAEREVVKEKKSTDFKPQEHNNRAPESPVTRVLDQIHGSYLLAETGEGLLIIDQHAAHERILYEGLKNKYNAQKITAQPLLIPLNLELSPPEIEFIKDYREELERLGFKLELFGTQSFIIREVPLLIKQRISKDVLREIIDKLLTEGEKLEAADLIKRIITFMSCRGAVNAGESLDRREYTGLIEDLFQTDNPYRCPHGRPTMIRLTGEELEKGLGRK